MIGLDTTMRKRRVAVVQLPTELGIAAERALFQEVERCMDSERPCVVIDCSSISQLHDSQVYLLLSCLEEAMKRNGDIKLAGLPSGSDGVLEGNGVGRLFEVFATIADAVNSFQSGPFAAVSEPLSRGCSNQESESAA